MNLSLKLAWRFLKSNKLQTTIVILVIALGISMQIFIGFLMQGLETRLVDKTLGQSAHITITNVNGDIDDTNNIIKTLSTIDGIKTISPTLQRTVFVDNNDSFILKGVNIISSSKMYGLKTNQEDGRLPKSQNEIYTNDSNLEVGEEINVISIGNENNVYNIVGKYKPNSKQTNTISYTPLTSMQQTYDLQNTSTNIEIQLDDVFQATEIKDSINLGNSYKVVSWDENNESLLSALEGQNTTSILIQVFVVVVVVLTTSLMLIINVVSKTKQLAILKAIGFTQKGITKLLFIQGFILGLIGTLLGIVLGIILLTGFETFVKDSSGVAIVDITLTPTFILISFATGLLSATISAIIPAQRTKKISIIEEIRNG